MPVFLKRKPADYLGVLREEPPKRLFASFLHAEKGRGRAFNILFGRIAFFYADIPQQKSSLRATFFLYTKKEGKDVPRGSPL